jgi:CubicO group peptidase (beta-lactamase class C family)
MNIDSAFLDGVATAALAAFQAPGLSLAVLTPNQILSRVYGVADLTTGEPLTTETAFPLASPTKSFTALALALLHQQGAFAWDQPVASLVPHLCDTRQEHLRPLTCHHLLSHQSAFGWHDPLWYNSPWDRATIIRKAWQAGPEREPGPPFQYSNLPYILAGEIVAHLAGMPYERFIHQRILAPLGLNSAHFAAEPAARLAASHMILPTGVERISTPDASKANAACGLRITASDLARWMAAFCRPEHTSLPPRAFQTLLEPRTAIGPLEGKRFYTLFGQPDWLKYGYGWFLRRFRGYRVVFHTGRLPGAATHLAFLPELHLGIAALTNATFACLAETIVMAVLERFAGGPQTNWVSYFQDVSQELTTAATAPPVAAAAATPAPDFATLAGDYHDPVYGLLQVCFRNHRLTFSWANYQGDLLPLSATLFSLRNLRCPFLLDAATVEFDPHPPGAALFASRRFQRLSCSAE